jgi:uncharacterized protein
MRRLSAAGVASIVLMILPVACSSPNPSLYTIAPVEGRPHSNGPPVVVVEQVALAHYLERSQIVRSSANYRLEVMENDWWGEPLSAMLTRVLVSELSQNLPHSTVINETGAVSATPDATVALNVQRLDENADGQLVLQAQASVSFKGQKAPHLRDFHLIVPPPAPGTPGEVAAISTAVGQLADALAALVAESGP